MLSPSELYLEFSPPDYNYKQINSYMNDPVELFRERNTNNTGAGNTDAGNNSTNNTGAGKTGAGKNGAGKTGAGKTGAGKGKTGAGKGKTGAGKGKNGAGKGKTGAGRDVAPKGATVESEKIRLQRKAESEKVKDAVKNAETDPKKVQDLSASDKVNLVKISDANSLSRISKADPNFLKTAVLSDPDKGRDAIVNNPDLYTKEVQEFIQRHAPEVDVEITNQILATNETKDIAKMADRDNTIVRSILNANQEKAIEIIDENPNIYKGDFKKYIEDNYPDIGASLNDKYGLELTTEEEIRRIETQKKAIRGSGQVMKGYLGMKTPKPKAGAGKASAPPPEPKGVNVGLATLLNIPTETTPLDDLEKRTEARTLTRTPAPQSKVRAMPDLPTENEYIAPPPVQPIVIRQQPVAKLPDVEPPKPVEVKQVVYEAPQVSVPKSAKIIRRTQRSGEEEIGFYDQLGKFIVIRKTINMPNESRDKIEERTILRSTGKPTYSSRLKERDAYDVQKELSELFTMMPQSSKSKGYSRINPITKQRTESFVENAENRFADIETRRRKNIMPTYIDEIKSPSANPLKNIVNSDSLSKDDKSTDMPNALKPSESPFILQYPAQNPKYNSMYNKLYGNMYGAEKSHQDMPASQSYVARPILNPDKVRKTILEKNKSGNMRDYLMTQVRYNLKYKPKDTIDAKLYDKLLKQVPEEKMFEYLYTLEEQNAVDDELEMIKKNEQLVANTENALDLAKGKVFKASKKPSNLRNMFIQESFEESKGGFKRSNIPSRIRKSTNPILNAVIEQQRQGSAMHMQGQSDAVSQYIDPLNAQYAGDLLSKLSTRTKSDKEIRKRRVKDMVLNEQINKEEGVDEFTGDLLYDHTHMGAPLEWRTRIDNVENFHRSQHDNVKRNWKRWAPTRNNNGRENFHRSQHANARRNWKRWAPTRNTRPKKENFEGSVANIWDNYTKYDYGSIGKQDVSYTGTSNTDLQQGFSAIVLPGNPVGSYVNYERIPYNVMPHSSYSSVEYRPCSSKEKESLVPRRKHQTNSCNARRIRQLD